VPGLGNSDAAQSKTPTRQISAPYFGIPQLPLARDFARSLGQWDLITSWIFEKFFSGTNTAHEE